MTLIFLCSQHSLTALLYPNNSEKNRYFSKDLSRLHLSFFPYPSRDPVTSDKEAFVVKVVREATKVTRHP